MASGRHLIDVTSSPFTSSRSGLLTVAEKLPDADAKRGILYQPYGCSAANATQDSCVDDVLDKSPTVTGAPSLGADPFTVYAWELCGPVGNLGEATKRTEALLERGEGRAVEHVFWTGDSPSSTPVYPHLASDADVFDDHDIQVQSEADEVTTTAVTPVEAVSLLEGELASCLGGEGVLHVPAAAVAHLAAQTQLWWDGDILRTVYGNKVAVYSPGDRTGPDGTDPGAGEFWFYATGPVTAYRSDVFVTPIEQSLDRNKNTLVMIAERTYVLKWDCCHLAAQVTMII